jgi:Fe-S oxidoreductase
MGALAPALTNAILTGPVTAPLFKRIAGVAQERPLPRLARQSYTKSRGAKSAGTMSARDAAGVGERVLLWPDTWNNYYHPQTLAAAETLLESAGFAVEAPRGPVCCGRPLYDFGLLGSARSYLREVLERTAAEIDRGLPFLFLEPSCASVFRDELLELLPGEPRAQKLRAQTWLLADWLAAKAPGFAAGRLQGARILVHGHCHHKAVFGGPESEISLLRQAGASVELIQAGCCGMAGPFGFEAGKFEVSKIIAGQELLPAIEAAPSTTILVADGFSCREQIAQLAHRPALHFAEVLAHECACGM